MKKLKFFLSRYLDIKKNDSYVDMKKIKKILFYKTEWKIGEYITSSFVIREIKKKYPTIQIDVFVGKSAGVEELLKNNKYINNFFVYDRKKKLEEIKVKKQVLKSAKIQKYDIFFDFSEEIDVKPKQIWFMRKLNSNINVGYRKDIYKIYNKNIITVKERISDTWEKALKILNIKNINKTYDILLKEESERNIEQYFLENHIDKSIAVNFFGSIEKRKINVNNALVLLKNLKKQYPEFKISILDSPADREKIFEILKKESTGEVYYYRNTSSIFDAISIIKRSEIVISPDTSIVHIAEGLNKKILAFYENTEFEKKRYVIKKKNKIIVYKNEINEINYNSLNYSI